MSYFSYHSKMNKSMCFLIRDISLRKISCTSQNINRKCEIIQSLRFFLNGKNTGPASEIYFTMKFRNLCQNSKKFIFPRAVLVCTLPGEKWTAINLLFLHNIYVCVIHDTQYLYLVSMIHDVSIWYPYQTIFMSGFQDT